MAEDYPLMIAGTDADKRLTVTAPFDGSEIGSAGIADADAIEQALITRIPLNDPFAFAARLGYLWWGASTYRTATRSRPGCDFLFECL